MSPTGTPDPVAYSQDFYLKGYPELLFGGGLPNGHGVWRQMGIQETEAVRDTKLWKAIVLWKEGGRGGRGRRRERLCLYIGSLRIFTDHQTSCAQRKTHKVMQNRDVDRYLSKLTEGSHSHPGLLRGACRSALYSVDTNSAVPSQ